EYFLNGVARQAEDALGRAERINRLLEEWRSRIEGASTKVALRILEKLAENPYCTVKGVAERLGVAFTTAQRAIERLERETIVVRTSDVRRNRVYCARAILDILEEPTNPGSPVDA
ncbi:MAG: winged helix-turn-helix domain-containing protein, partial [Candidatus Binatia bacterium]